MSRNFDELLSKVREVKTKKVAVAVAQDEPVLEAVKSADRKSVV